jgi:hypothetical protein
MHPLSLPEFLQRVRATGRIHRFLHSCTVTEYPSRIGFAVNMEGESDPGWEPDLPAIRKKGHTSALGRHAPGPYFSGAVHIPRGPHIPQAFASHPVRIFIL